MHEPHQERPGFDNHRGVSTYIHESSIVEQPCQIGDNTQIMAFTHIMAHAIIGQWCHIGHHVTMASGVVLGNQVRVMNNALLNSGVILEDGVYCGPSTVFAPPNRIRGFQKNVSKISPTVIRTGASIGPNTTITSGITVGQYAFVEAGTVIDRNIQDFALVYGNPLQFGGWRCECGEALSFPEKDPGKLSTCDACHQRYQMKAVGKTPVIQKQHATVVIRKQAFS